MGVTARFILARQTQPLSLVSLLPDSGWGESALPCVASAASLTCCQKAAVVRLGFVWREVGTFRGGVEITPQGVRQERRRVRFGSVCGGVRF